MMLYTAYYIFIFMNTNEKNPTTIEDTVPYSKLQSRPNLSCACAPGWSLGGREFCLCHAFFFDQ